MDTDEITRQLIRAYDRAETIAPITAGHPEFSVEHAYAVQAEIGRRRRMQGWEEVGRKIGFTNRTIWARYGVHQPLWAHVWRHTVQYAPDRRANLGLGSMAQPRIEPEVAFKLRGPITDPGDPIAVLNAVEWMAPAFEVVQSHFPDWTFQAPDCTAALGLHGALAVGPPVPIRPEHRQRIAAALADFDLTLSRNGVVVEQGRGGNVLGSPALALGHLANLLALQPKAPPLVAGEVVTTGTLTDAWPIAPGETWSADYGKLGLGTLTIAFH